MLPLLPGYLRQHGSSPSFVGLVMSAYFAAAVLTQYPIGRLTDRIGCRSVLLTSLLLFGLASVGFDITSGPIAAIAFRGLQGVGAGAVTVASKASVATSLPLGERGRAFGVLYASEMLALAIGPLVGSIAGYSSLHLLFAAAAAGSAAAALPVLIFVATPARPARAQRDDEGADMVNRMRAFLPMNSSATEPFFGPRVASFGAHFPPGVIGAIGFFAAVGFQTGVYTACWSLLLRLRGASAFETGLSFTLFALPFAVMSVPAGRLAERIDPRRLAIAATTISMGFACVYPFIHNVGWLISLGSVEAIGAAFGGPAALVLIARSISPSEQGAAQGTVETAQVAATAIAAAATGALFGLNPIAPFVGASVLSLVCVVVMAIAWRNTGPPDRLATGDEDSPRT
jgi:MFS family permease